MSPDKADNSEDFDLAMLGADDETFFIGNSHEIGLPLETTVLTMLFLTNRNHISSFLSTCIRDYEAEEAFSHVHFRT